VHWAFDLMQLNGNDLRAVHLEERKRRLGHLIGQSAIACLLHYDTFDDGERLLAECEKRGIEGVVAKHRASIYRSGRSASFSMKANVSRSLCDEAMSKTGTPLEPVLPGDHKNGASAKCGGTCFKVVSFPTGT
jgi:ATP dependent DNA ligase domain